MARFITRVELHDATYNDYQTLHSAMEKEGFTRTITASTGVIYHLPTAEYDLVASITKADALARAKRAAKTTGKTFGVIVTESNGSTWDGLVPVKP